MNDDSPFESYLSDRAASIPAAGAGPAAIARRAAVRRRRRRAGTGAVLGAAILVVGVVAGQGLRADDDSQEIASYGAGIVDPTLDWTVVDVDRGRGLGWSHDMAEVGSGELYGISTAPGPFDAERQLQTRLYRSGDGSEWSEVALPGGMSPNDLAADGDAVVAVGTSAAGGDVRVQVARSTSPGDEWSVTDVPLDLGAMATAAGLPGRLYAADTSTAVHGGRTVVAVNVLADIDVHAVLPDEEQPDAWYPTVEGMERSGPTCGTDDPTATTGPPTAEPDSAPTTTADRVEAAGRGGDRVSHPEGEGCVPGREQEVRTWTELGYGEEVARLIGGQTHVFASDDAGDLQPATVLDRSTGFENSLLAADDGVWLVAPAYTAETETIVAHRSVDGVDWSEPPVDVPGSVVTTGVLEGRLAVLASDWDAGRLVLHSYSGAGVESHDLTELAGLTPEGDRYPEQGGIGPLGVAVVIGSNEPGQRGVVLHSTDGVAFSRTDLPAAPDGKRQSVNGMTMTADAVKVRLNVRDADDLAGEGPPDQRLLVGTPR